MIIGVEAMRVGVVGINHKLADLKLREKLAKACQRRFGAAYSLHQGHHFVLLSTCNRTEVYFSSEDLAETHQYLLDKLRQEVEEEFDHKLYSYFGKDCFTHLVRVTIGLDSAVLAETEIQGQVKSAYECALEYRTLPKEIHFLFQKSLHIAKKIRSEMSLGRGLPSLEQAIFQTGKQFFFEEKPKILFVGASEINLKILTYLKTKGHADITICNRTIDSSLQIAERQKTAFLKWENLIWWHDYDWVIFGTKSPNYLIGKQDVPQGMVSRKLVMDLSVPRNVEPKLDQDGRITLLNIDQINRQLRVRNRQAMQVMIEAEDRILFNVELSVESYQRGSRFKEDKMSAATEKTG